MGSAMAFGDTQISKEISYSIGLHDGSRRAAEELLNDPRWRHHRNLVTLIPDSMTLRALFFSEL